MLASIVTPTLPRRESMLIERCIPSIKALDWPDIEHIIISDPNPGLDERLAPLSQPGYKIRFAEINDTWRDGIRDRSIGAIPWYIGSMMVLGEYVSFVGDDDELLPDHVTRHAAALQNFDFSVSPIQFRANGDNVFIIGDAFVVGHLDATGIMCRREALRVANWTATGENAADFRLVAEWMRAGLRGTMLGGAPTGIHNDGWLTGQTGV